MNVLHITSDETHIAYVATLAEARGYVKDTPQVYRAALRVDLHDMRDDKAAIVNLLNKMAPELGAVLRSWKGTARGGLVETT